MWKLTIEDDEGQRTSLDLNLEEYSVGRAEDNDIRLTERNVSRSHAVLRNRVDGWEIVDEGSYNGTFVNGERVVGDGAILATGDVINLGDYRVELLDWTEEQPAPDAEPTNRKPDRLICVIGPVPGHEFVLDGDVMTMGRAEEAGVFINHASVSRLHAELHNLGDSRWEVVDQGSSNGIRINGVELRRGIIEPGDALEFGDVRLRFVAAGKFYRPVVDVSQQLPAIPFDGMTAGVGSQRGGRRMGMALGALLFVGLAVIGGWRMFSGGDSVTAAATGSTPPMATSEAQARAYLDKATHYAATGDIFNAHNHLQSIGEDSPLRESAEFRKIEDQWADAMFSQAEDSQDPEEKRRLLIEISDTTSVSRDKRRKALQMAGDIASVDDVDKGGRGRPTGTVGGRLPTTLDVPTGTTTSTKPPPAPASSSKPGGGGKFDTNAAKTRLYTKMANGTADKSELLQLKALCMQDGDKACRNAAAAKAKAMK